MIIAHPQSYNQEYKQTQFISAGQQYKLSLSEYFPCDSKLPETALDKSPLQLVEQRNNKSAFSVK